VLTAEALVIARRWPKSMLVASAALMAAVGL
jgi:hypothetical protein